MNKFLDTGTIIVIIVTILLFTAALFIKGFTRDPLLEAGVLLVSIKLIMMAFKNNQNYNVIKQELDELKKMLNKNQNTD